MSMNFNSACISYIGCGRENNEDNFCFNGKRLAPENSGTEGALTYSGNTDEYRLFAVFDGMGGENAGEKAAFSAAEAFLHGISFHSENLTKGKELFLSLCKDAQKDVRDISRTINGTVGTTVVSLLFSGDVAVSCNLGDSKAYRVRDKKMMMLSEEHTDAGIIKALGLDKKPRLMQFLGMDENVMKPDPYITKGNIESGDMYILCSDGVSDVLCAQEIYDAVRDKNALSAVKSLIDEVKKKNGGDNATAIVINFD